MENKTDFIKNEVRFIAKRLGFRIPSISDYQMPIQCLFDLLLFYFYLIFNNTNTSFKKLNNIMNILASKNIKNKNKSNTFIDLLSS